jgi:GT2 family glycosyltransferase
MPLPLVSVVVPTLGREQFLWLTLRSALRQRDVDLEVIVVDDGPSESAAAVVERLDDPRIRLRRHRQRRGAAAARNTGIAHARGEWVAFLDDDDLWAPDKLAAQLAAAQEADCDWVYTGAAAVDQDHRVLHVEPPVSAQEVVAWLPVRNVVPAGASNVLVRARALAAVGGFDETLRYVEDWELFIRLARRSAPAHLPAPLVAVRWHAGQSSLDTRKLRAALTAFEARHGGSVGPVGPVDRAAIHRDAAWASLRAGRRWAAVRQYGYAVRDGDLLSLARAGVAALPARVRRVVLNTREPGGEAHDGAVAAVQAWVDELVTR